MNTVRKRLEGVVCVFAHLNYSFFSVYSFKADILNYINLASVHTMYDIILVYCFALNTVFLSTNAFRH